MGVTQDAGRIRMVLHDDQRSEPLIQTQIQTPHSVGPQDSLQLLLRKFRPCQMMVRTLYDDLMGPQRVHDIERSLRPAIEIALDPTQWLEVRGHSDPPAGLIPLTRGLAEGNDLGRGHRLIAWTEWARA